MKQRGWPLWLLRDVRAFMAVMLSFWTLMIFTITSGRTAMRHGRVTRAFLNRYGMHLANAEAQLDWALWRQAHRRLGLDLRAVQPNIILPPKTSAETLARWHSYSHAFRNMHCIVDSYVEHLRARYRISERDAANAGSCPLRLATRSTSPMLRMEEEMHSPQAQVSFLLRRSRGRWHALARDGGGSRSSRGPPTFASTQTAPPRRPHLRERPRMRAA